MSAPATRLAPVSIPDHVAAWIRTVVLPEAYRRNTINPGLCPCQWGVCGHCNAGRHDQCAVTTFGGAPNPSPETYICDPRGTVAALHGVPSKVWRAGRPCRWICSCTACPQAPAAPPGGAPVSIQLDLFAGLLEPAR